ncbi:electron transport complex protein RnfD [Desulfocicer vacuolatum DSM 3385]|uniref:Ion-translocating oxidoreductase complex subunit D n=1 Tax=Desulfocicer vacuolatum DSM 3385 TaxID=1121400 RepID=A0A1W2D5T6_9BACT|nr:RnfABCDGE type electron transport complex subunit D [Desulfocicer vacuolatum]SMC92452.1 electron transport complex protein RnfD [Desulfocicer vacuolatum DSM 3385]
MSEKNEISGQGLGSDIAIHVAPSPHLSDQTFTTRRMMTDVLIGLLPLVVMSVYVFRMFAVTQLVICVLACMASEFVFVKMRSKPVTLNDFSAVVTGVILALSLPGTAPWYVGVLASVIAIGIGKVIFGGLGMNIFNPAMVGRAFVMIAFASAMGASAYINADGGVDAMSMATPLTAFKQSGVATSILDLFVGVTNGSLGETSAFACLLGGGYLLYRRTASWEIPAGILSTVIVLSAWADMSGGFGGGFVLHQLFGGALLFGTFFIATDPVSSPVTPKGKWIFGIGAGALIMVIRLFSGYPEGVMFAVLLMNAMTPLINRWTIPKPTGVA